MSDQTTNLYSYNEGVKTNSCRGDLTPRITTHISLESPTWQPLILLSDPPVSPNEAH